MEVRKDSETEEIKDLIIDSWMVCFCIDNVIQYYHKHTGTSGEYSAPDGQCSKCGNKVPKQVDMLSKLQRKLGVKK